MSPCSWLSHLQACCSTGHGLLPMPRHLLSMLCWCVVTTRGVELAYRKKLWRDAVWGAEVEA
jgi:hypothetical protein